MNRKLISSFGAALAVLTLAISPATQALIIQNAKDSIVYAKETLPVAGAVTVGGTTYYHLGHDLTVNAPAGIGATANDVYTVTYTLSGMVFGAVAALPTEAGAAYTRVSGGAINDTTVTFRAGGAIADTATSIDATFRLRVSESGGSITRTVMNSSLPSNVKRSETHTGHVMVAPVLSEKPTRMDSPKASADLNFVDFGPNLATGTRVVTARLGSLSVGVKMGMMGATPSAPGVTPVVAGMADTRYRNAAASTAVNGAAVVTADTEGGADANGVVDQLSEITMGLGSTDANQSTATVAGDVSFVKKIGFSGGDVCGAVTDIRKPATAPATGYSDEFKSILVNNTAFTADPPNNLCVTADGETAIPEGFYTVTTSYVKLDGSAFAPVGATHTLGKIERDGVTKHIPYLTTYEGYNQRLILRNRSSRAVSYTVTFATEMEVVATPPSVTGALAAGEVEVLRIQDMVELTGGSRAAATVTSNAADGRLDVASTIVNLEDRSTDTIRY